MSSKIHSSSASVTQQRITIGTKSKYAGIIALLLALGGGSIIGLGTATYAFNLIGVIPLITTVSGGGGLIFVGVCGLTAVALVNCKNRHAVPIKRIRAVEPAEDSSTSSEEEFPYPTIGQEALAFARKMLEENPDLEPHVFMVGLYDPQIGHQPVNKEISLLKTLYDSYKIEFEKKVRKYENPWKHKDVIQAADNVIKIGYAIGCLALEDLPEFTRMLEEEHNETRTYAQAISRQDSYLFRTYFYLPFDYMTARAGVVWTKQTTKIESYSLIIDGCKVKQPSQIIQRKGLFSPLEENSKHTQRFYKDDTLQSNWRELYNDYSNRVTSYVTLDEFQNDTRYANWIKEDNDAKTFAVKFDSLPT